MKTLLQSMTTRVFLVLIGGVVLSVLLTLYLAGRERQRMIGEFRDYHAVERVADFVLSLETVPAPLRESYLSAATGIGIRARLATPQEQPSARRTPLADLLASRLPEGHRIESAPLSADDCPPPQRGPAARRRTDRRPPCEALLVTLHDGTRLRLSVIPPRPPPLAPRFDYRVYGILFLLSIGVLAAFVARMTMRPLKRLSAAATALGHDIERPPLPERGAIEIRQAAAAFNAMQGRIKTHIQQRSRILAAITHDLQTPLTRLRLRLEKVDDLELREKLVADLSAMQGMVREGLDLARSMEPSEPPQLMDLDSLLESVCDDATDAGQEVTLSGSTRTSLRARPLALRRCLTNLIDNAVKYGQRADVVAERIGPNVRIRIRDHGPGIPAEEQERVFDPFYRLESSRSRSTGGTGLGLTIARNIAAQHGGAISLRNLPDGGLEASLTLPVPAAA